MMFWIRKYAHFWFLFIAFVGFFVFEENPIHLKRGRGFNGGFTMYNFEWSLQSMVFTVALLVSLIYYVLKRIGWYLNPLLEQIHLLGSMFLAIVIFVSLFFGQNWNQGQDDLSGMSFLLIMNISFIVIQLLFFVNLIKFGTDQDGLMENDILDAPH